MSATSRVLVVLDDGSWNELALTAVHVARALTDGVGTVPIVAWHHGPLLRHLRTQGDLLDVDDLNEGIVPRALESTRAARVGGGLKNRRLRRWLRARPDVDVILVIGLRALRLVEFLPRPRPRVVCLVDHIDPGDLDGSTADLSLDVTFVVAELAHSRALVKAGVADRCVIVEPAALLPEPAASRSAAGLNAGQRHADDPLVIVAAGTQSWWMDPDPFFVIASAVHEHSSRPVRFVWLAPVAPTEERWLLDHERRNCELEGQILVNTSPTPLDALDSADVLLLTGRSSTHYRSLMMEARRRKIPVVGDDEMTDLDVGRLVSELSDAIEGAGLSSRADDDGPAIGDEHALVDLLVRDPRGGRKPCP